jgi:ATP-dependent exoDNAse (exonuclease V) alpha subunit
LEHLHIEDISNSTLRIKSSKKMILKNVNTIIIDEISMVRADTFDKIDKILRTINGNDKPFGGKQILIFGDLFQLPPIAKREEIKFLTDRYGGVYFFQSEAYKKGSFNFVELSINHRQKDDVFFYEILNRVREGKTTNHDITVLNKRVIKNSEDLRRVLTLFPKKADAEWVNREELEKIEAKEYSYDAKIIFNKKNQQTPNLDNKFPIMNVLKLKRGALVMLVTNDPGGRWVNGTLGIVSSLQDDEIKVSIDGRNYDVTPFTFTEQEAIYKNGRINYEDVLKVEQFPIVLAYAITIHKSQGMTYKRIACDITTCFTSGQAYVALSRCSSLEGLHLLDEVSDDITKVDNLVKEFYLHQSRLNNTITN